MTRVFCMVVCLAAAIAVGGLSCTFAPPQVAGAGSETTNSLAGCIVSSGSPAVVRLIPDTFDCVSGSASSIRSDTADASGRYRFGNPDTGTYNIEARETNGRRTIVFGVHYGGGSDTAPTDSTRIPGTVTMQVPPGFDSLGGYVYVPGTFICAILQNERADSIRLDSVPAVVLPLVAHNSTKARTAPKPVRFNFPVTPGANTVLAYPGFVYGKRLYLNTSATGASVPQTVTGFPVLVRLAAAFFDFSTAQQAGRDIRFANAQGRPLPYQIELWDAAGKQAAVWVRADTVAGNCDTAYIQLCWGNAGAPAAVQAGAVFDTASGFAGVWHLDPSLADATVYADNGRDSSTADAPGIIGRCRQFDPQLSSYISIPHQQQLNLTTAITVSAWVRVDTISVIWQTIVAKGDSAYRLHMENSMQAAAFSITTADTGNFGYKDVFGTTLLNDHAWHLVTGVFDGSREYLYTDGRLEGTANVSFPCLVSAMPLTIGDNRQYPLRYFAGLIDEVRVMGKVMNADWIKLCYMNQKANDALVIFK